MYDSPLEWCDHCKAWIALDQTFAECSRECHCTPQECPLAAFLRPDRELRPEVPGDSAFELR